MSDVPALKRDGTMEVTAKAGKEFLESHGMAVTDDDVKTRAQKEKLEEISSTPSNGDKGEAEERAQESSKDDGTPPPKIPRDNTMQVTAKEGEMLLAGEELEKTRSKTAERTPKSTKSPRGKRTTPIAQTTQDSSLILGQNSRGRTRSQTRKISESGEEEKKPSMKRTGTMEQTIKDAEVFLGSEAKKAKIDNGTDKIAEADETPCSEEAQAEA